MDLRHIFYLYMQHYEELYLACIHLSTVRGIWGNSADMLVPECKPDRYSEEYFYCKKNKQIVNFALSNSSVSYS